jgi:hypothetical protein
MSDAKMIPLTNPAHQVFDALQPMLDHLGAAVRQHPDFCFSG